MFELRDFSSWTPFEGVSEGSGRSEKIWLISSEGQIGLFKFPKIDIQTGHITTEHISEHLAHQLGKILHVSTANVDMGIYENRLGSMSYLVKKPAETLIEGINFISGMFPKYNDNLLFDEQSGKYYCVEHILRSTHPLIPPTVWIRMMLFDFVIGNADRHQSNWAILASFDSQKKTIHLRNCPLYDNGSSLCCYVNERQISRYFGPDSGPINALVDSKSKSIIRIDGYSKSRPRHSDVVRYLLTNYDETSTYAKSFLSALTDQAIDDLLFNYPIEVLSEEKNKLIRCFLKSKMALLKAILEE